MSAASTILLVLLVYFLGGLLILTVFDLTTRRIRTNIADAGMRAQIRMAEAGNPMGQKAGLALMLILTWLFWPAVLIGAATSRKGGNDNGAQEQREDSTNPSRGGEAYSDSASEETGEQPDRPSGPEASQS